MVAIRVIGLSKDYPDAARAVAALAPLDIDIASGEVVVVIGPSGCGKSTLLRLMAGLEQPTAGRIAFGCAGPKIGMVFQDIRLFPWLDVVSNVGLPLRVAGIGKRERDLRARALCHEMGLAGFEHHLPATLSGGMAQRAALARAFAQNPAILLLDEPFAALDAITRAQMNRELRGHCRRLGATVILVTHSLDEAVQLGDRIVVLSRRPGQIVRIVRPAECDCRPGLMAELRLMLDDGHV